MSVLIDAIGFSLTSLEDFESRDLAQAVIERLMRVPKELRPRRYGFDEPVSEPIAGTNLRPVIGRWLHGPGDGVWPGNEREGGVMMRGAGLAGFQVSWRKGTERSFAFVGGQVGISLLRQQPQLRAELESLSKDLISLVRPVYGEIRNMSLKGADLPFDLRRRLPDIPWVSIYGPPYVSLFGRDHLLSAPFAHVEEVQPGHVWARASDSVFEAIPEEVKAGIRIHLGEDAFMSGGRWRYTSGRAPGFDSPT